MKHLPLFLLLLMAGCAGPVKSLYPPQIVKFLKQVFPNDQIIQALKETHH